MSTIDIVLLMVLPVGFLLFLVGILGGWMAREYMMNYREIQDLIPKCLMKWEI